MTDESETAKEADWERELQEQVSHGAGKDYDELEHLKEQYVDGKLTEAEFEARAEELVQDG